MTYADFWAWFQKNEKQFFNAVKRGENIETDFFDHLSPELNKIKEGIYFLTGMCNENTAELILTPDGAIERIVFVEELVAAAPEIACWKFTCLKPAAAIENSEINMAGYNFNRNNLYFYENGSSQYPDEIAIAMVYDDYNDEDEPTIKNGIYIFLDSYLGELNSVSLIDSIRFVKKENIEKDLVPIEKIKDYLIWRQKEFVEKYDDVQHNSDNDIYSSLTATLRNGKELIASVNSTLLNWDSKASHPWMLTVKISFESDGSGLPDSEDYELMNNIEDDLLEQLTDSEGYLNIGRETADGLREIFIACKDFRKPSKIMAQVISYYSNKLPITFDIYKDKYWRTVDHLIPNK